MPNYWQVFCSPFPIRSILLGFHFLRGEMLGYFLRVFSLTTPSNCFWLLYFVMNCIGSSRLSGIYTQSCRWVYFCQNINVSFFHGQQIWYSSYCILYCEHLSQFPHVSKPPPNSLNQDTQLLKIETHAWRVRFRACASKQRLSNPALTPSAPVGIRIWFMSSKFSMKGIRKPRKGCEGRFWGGWPAALVAQ